MAQAEPSNVSASCHGEDGGDSSVGEAYSIVAGDQYVTPSPSMSSSSQSREYVSAGMSEPQIMAAIEKSKEQGWSELADGVADAAAASCHGQDALIWEELKERNPRVFRDMSEDELKLGQVIAEGGQAQIYEASIKDDDQKYVAKAFKMEGFSLADLKRQWPLVTKAPTDRDLIMDDFVFGEIMSCCCCIHWGTFLKDGRFAFVMPRYWGDLRTLINLKLSDNNLQGPPFSHAQALWIMDGIARGMRELHARGVLHRDLKAANVLISRYNRLQNDDEFKYSYEVADFESSMLVQGTGFWRAPEVLEDLQKKGSDRHAEIWTEKVDVYSYAMTCYEILTGHTPFYGYLKSDWKRVIDGERPHLPNYVDSKLQELMERCWHKEPSKRPTFDVILATRSWWRR